MSNSILTISSENKSSLDSVAGKITSREYAYSNLSRSRSLPKNVNIEQIVANYDAGILYISIPLSENDLKRTTIKVG